MMMMKLVCSAALVGVLVLCFAICCANSDPRVTLKLKSKVALVNTTVEFSCAGYGSEDNTCAEAQVELNDNIEKLTNKLQVNISQYAAEITKTQNDTTNFVTFSIKILAKLANNNTKIVCDFCPDYNFKTEARLYIASDMLGSNEGFKTPVFSSNSSAIVASWSSPWYHRVNNYTVTVVDRASGDWTNHFVHSDTTYIIQQDVNSSYSECHEFDFFVSASTDIGDTKSAIVRSGFSKEVESIKDDDLSINVLKKVADGKLEIEAHVKEPAHCSMSQHILYNFTLSSNGSQFNHHGPTDKTNVHFEGLLEEDRNYTLQLTYWDENMEVKKKVITKTISEI